MATDHEVIVEALLANMLSGDPELADLGLDGAAECAELAVLKDGDDDEDASLTDIASALTFEDHGVLTSNRGIVLDLTDGSQFQITIVQSRRSQ